MEKKCDLCYEADMETEVVASHTFYTEKNTMTWCCDKHAEELIEEASRNPGEWVGSRLVPTVEESYNEAQARIARQNLLRFPLRAVS